jgi:hypothetical protein
MGSENLAGPQDGQGSPGVSAHQAAELYGLISADPDLTQSLFRQALQDPSGALARIVAIGVDHGLSVDPADVKRYLASLDDGSTKQWLLKARGGL